MGCLFVLTQINFSRLLTKKNKREFAVCYRNLKKNAKQFLTTRIASSLDKPVPRLIRSKFVNELHFISFVIKSVSTLGRVRLIFLILLLFYVLTISVGLLFLLALCFLMSLAFKNYTKARVGSFLLLWFQLTALLVYIIFLFLFIFGFTGSAAYFILYSLFYFSKFLFAVTLALLLLPFHGIVVTWLLESNKNFIKFFGRFLLFLPSERVMGIFVYATFLVDCLQKTLKQFVNVVFSIKFVLTVGKCAITAVNQKKNDKTAGVVYSRRTFHRNTLIYRFVYLLLCEFFTQEYRRVWALHTKKYFDWVLRLWTVHAYDAVQPFFISILAIIVELFVIPLMFLMSLVSLRVFKDCLHLLLQKASLQRLVLNPFSGRFKFLKNAFYTTKFMTILWDYYFYIIFIVRERVLSLSRRERFIAIRLRFFRLNTTQVFNKEIGLLSCYELNRKIVDYVRSLVLMYLRLSFFKNINKSCYRLLKKNPVQVFFHFFWIITFFCIGFRLLCFISNAYFITQQCLCFTLLCPPAVATVFSAYVATRAVVTQLATRTVISWRLYYIQKWAQYNNSGVEVAAPYCSLCFVFACFVYVFFLFFSFFVWLTILKIQLKTFIFFSCLTLLVVTTFILSAITYFGPTNGFVLVFRLRFGLAGYVVLWLRIFLRVWYFFFFKLWFIARQ